MLVACYWLLVADDLRLLADNLRLPASGSNQQPATSSVNLVLCNMGQYLSFHISDVQATEHNVEKILKQAIKARDCLLEECPDLREFQDEIDRLLRGAGSFENRMAVLEIMTEASFNELRHKLSELLNIIRVS